MAKMRMLFSSLLMLVAALLVVPATNPAHGQSTGTVCIIQMGASSCPSTPATIVGKVGSQLRVSVFIQGSNGLGGFDITLLADHTILQPSGVDLTGTVMLSPFIVSECIGGVQKLPGGQACLSTATTDTIALAVYNCGPCGNTITPTTGLLFTAIYNVVGPTTSTPIGFQTGCGVYSPSSVSGTTICVAVVNGGLFPVPENVQTAVFTSPQTISFAGVTVTVSSTFTVNTTTNTLSGTASVSVVNSTTGATIVSKTFTISLAFGTRNSIRLVLAVPEGSLVLGVNCSVSTGSTPAATCSVSRDPDINHDGTVDIVDFSTVAYAYGSTIGMPRYSPAVDLDLDGNVNILDLAIVAAYYGAPVFY